MTNERAIELLNRISDSQFDGPHGDERREALSMAVRALEGDGDTISRQQAIEALHMHLMYRMGTDSNKKRLDDWINGLPSAQPERPEQPESAKEYCAECNHIEMCRWYPYEGCEFRSLPSAQLETHDKRTETHECDLIGRQQAIEAFEPDHYIDWYTPTIIDTLEALPSVQPEMLACGNGELVKGSDGLVNDLVKDCISRQAAIDLLKQMRKDGDMIPWEGKDVFARIRKLPSVQPEERWIPCSERLPDIKEYYVSEPCIVYCENGAYGFAELEENIFGQVGWNCERDDDYHEPLGEVLAWMPLPKPYGGESDE